MNRCDLFLVKVAEAVAEEGITPWQTRNIEKAIQETSAKTQQEEKLHQLTGKNVTPVQLGRWGAIGGTFGTVGHLMGEGITGGKAGLLQHGLNKRKLLAAASRGALFGAIVPATRRAADVKSAKEGWY